MLPLQLINPLPKDSVPEIPDPKQELEMLKSLPLDEVMDKLVNAAAEFAIHLAVAIIVFYVGRFIIRKIYKVIGTIMVHRKVDRSLTTFILSLINIVLYFILLITVIGILGLETSSFLAIFASVGVAIGMALSGTLQNFAGGVLILLLKPYKIGDYIEAQGYAGTVKEIQIFHTIITTYDNKSIIIPNGGLSTGSINNWNREAYRRVDWTISISYGDDVATARKVITDILLADHRVVKEYVEDHAAQLAEESAEEAKQEAADEEAAAEAEEKQHNWVWRLLHRRRKAIAARIESISEEHRTRIEHYNPRIKRHPEVVLDTMADSSINLKVRAWTRTSDYWTVYYEMNETFYNELPKAGLSFPFPQMDVHIDHPSES